MCLPEHAGYFEKTDHKYRAIHGDVQAEKRSFSLFLLKEFAYRYISDEFTAINNLKKR